MFDPHMVTTTAKEAVKRFGADAVLFSHDQAEMARVFGDARAALAWAEIAQAVEQLIAMPISGAECAELTIVD
jgi:hypothetical protein